jgi:hypothetical protein
VWWSGAALSTLAILVATLHRAGTELPSGWRFNLSSGDSGLAELIQNLLLFIPLGLSLALAGVRPWRAITLGALLSFSVEFAQQWIPGRDPNVGDIICNTAGTAIGVALAWSRSHWFFTPPRRSAWHALATAVLAVCVWLGTGALLRPTFPAAPLTPVTAPDLHQWGRFRGKVVWVRFAGGILSVEAIAPPPGRMPGRESPLAVVFDAHGTMAVVLAVDSRDLELSYHTPAARLTLEQPELRWRGALTPIAPGDTFTASAGHDENGICMAVNREFRCGFGYTIGDGWKLLFDPEVFPEWALVLLNSLWVAGWMIGVGWWAGRTAVGGGRGRYEAVFARVAVGIVLVGLVVVPWLTGLNGTSFWEWVGALGGIEAGLVLGNRVLKDRLGESARP